MHDDINWGQFFNGGSFEDISKSENQSYIVVVCQDPFTNEITEETLFNITDVDRPALMAADCYLEYFDKPNKKRGRKKKNPEKIAIRYDFVKKIIDHKNNLIIVADEERDSFQYGELIETFDIDEFIKQK